MPFRNRPVRLTTQRRLGAGVTTILRGAADEVASRSGTMSDYARRRLDQIHGFTTPPKPGAKSK